MPHDIGSPAVAWHANLMERHAQNSARGLFGEKTWEHFIMERNKSSFFPIHMHDGTTVGIRFGLHPLEILSTPTLLDWRTLLHNLKYLWHCIWTIDWYRYLPFAMFHLQHVTTSTCRAKCRQIYWIFNITNRHDLDVHSVSMVVTKTKLQSGENHHVTHIVIYKTSIWLMWY